MMNRRMIPVIIACLVCWVLIVPVMADEGYWKSRSIDSAPDDLGQYCSLKIDGNDTAYIAYN